MDEFLAKADAQAIGYSIRIREAFDLFDSDNADMISKREVPSALRYLGIFPKERELVIDIIDAMQDDEPNEGFIPFKNFHRETIKLIGQKDYEPASADLLLEAFRMIDTQNNGYIEGDVMEKLLLTKGEVFRQQELEDFYAVARDPDTGRIMYENYVTLATKGRY